jgi:hypothetical protein
MNHKLNESGLNESGLNGSMSALRVCVVCAEY